MSEGAPLSASSSLRDPHQSPEALLLFSKLSPPRLPTLLVERPSLLARLDTDRLHTLTLLQAPAGFGKTTIVTQWITIYRMRGAFPAVAWVSLDSGDNDLFRYWRALITACQTFQQNLGQATLAYLSEAVQPPFQIPSMETVLTPFLNDLARHVPDGLLVLDDYHTIEEPAIHETLTFFIDHLPTTLHVLLLSRREPPLPLLRWRARGELSKLHAADLRFSSEETAAFLRQSLATSLSDTALTQLETSLEGWAAGLCLLILTLQGRRTAQEIEHALLSLVDDGADPSHARQPLLDYFVTEILQAQPEPLQRFLLQTSVLSRLSGPLCDAVTGEANGAAQLEAVERAGLFLEAMDGVGEWYRFHALWASAMRREAIQCLGEEALQVLSLRASRWYEQHAIEAALFAQDFERAALLIEQVDVDGQLSELHTVRRWLSPVPEAVLRAHPMLCWLAALSFQILQEEDPVPTTARERVETLLQMAKEGWQLHRGWRPPERDA